MIPNAENHHAAELSLAGHSNDPLHPPTSARSIRPVTPVGSMPMMRLAAGYEESETSEEDELQGR